MVPLRVIQTIILSLFILCLGLSPDFSGAVLPPDAFLRLDPLILLGAGIASRTLFAFFWIPLLLLAATLILGRFFCSHVCPLGITIDFVDRMVLFLRKKIPFNPALSLNRIPYLMLIFILTASLLSVSFVFLVSPVSLATRFYGTVILPGVRLILSEGLQVLRIFTDNFDIEVLDYAVIVAPRFSQVWANTLILLLIFSGSILAPRFWCRYICPSGAVFSIFSIRPLFRRSVSEDCIDCGICRKKCPMDAIAPSHRDTDYKACIVCQNCSHVCPVDAVAFRRWGGALPLEPSRQRRYFIMAAVAGAGSAFLPLINASGFYRPGDALPSPKQLIRPPGSMPENRFLARCVRCGACMTACPTNTLQPVGLAAGFSGWFSPAIVPEMGPCEPECRQCGAVCPTQAIPELSRSEKIAAKVGTARINRTRCLAWESDKPCLICDEVCPFDAIEFKRLPNQAVAVPFVNEIRCWGCGFCESKCPVRPDKAVVVEPAGALRLQKGSFVMEARNQGLDLSIQRKKIIGISGDGAEGSLPLDTLPPGFTE